MYKSIAALLLLVALTNGQLVGWRNCGSNLATVHRIRITGCSQTPCDFAVGQIVYVEVDATSLSNSNNLPFAVTVLFLGQQLPLHEGNACTYLIDGACPARIGESFTFRQQYSVPPIIPPGVTTVITSTMWNDFGDIGICIQVDARIVAATNEITVQ